MQTNRANINAAAKLIADAMGMVVKAREDEKTHRLHVSRELADKDPASKRLAYIYLTCESGYSAGGDWWKGTVSVMETKDRGAATPMETIAGATLVQPWGRKDGAQACTDTRKQFCKYAQKFQAPASTS